MSTETEKKPVNEMGDNPHINSNDGSSDTDEKKDIREQNTGPVCEEDPTKVVLRGIKGTVKWFSISKGFGFIHRHDNDKDVFVHSTAIVQRDDRRWHFALSPEQEVEFDVVSGFKGPKAQAVTLPGGEPIETLRLYERFNRGRKIGGGRRRSKAPLKDVETEKSESDAKSDSKETDEEAQKDQIKAKNKRRTKKVE